MERRREPPGPHPGHPRAARRPRLAGAAPRIAQAGHTFELNAANARWIRSAVSLTSGAPGRGKACQTRAGDVGCASRILGGMAMSLPAGEPAAGSWQAVRTSELMQLVAAAARVPSGRPRVLAVDGRGGSGKSTLAERLR